MTSYRIPFNRASFVGTEIEQIQAAVDAGHVSGDGPFGRQCEGLLRDLTGAKRMLLTTSCTHALELCALVLELKEGDEVIVPSFTFVSTANAFALRGVRIVFADIRPDTLNIDEERLEELYTERTRAVVVVHYGGVGCQMQPITEQAAARGVVVIEDNAHGLLGRYRGQPLGSFGALATLSFHETKNFSCGEGGALVVNDERYIEAAEIVREKGTNRSRFFRGLVDKYTWVGLGSSYVMSDLLAAVLWAQLEARDSIQLRRQELWQRYDDGLRAWCAREGVRQPIVPGECEPAWHLYYLLLPTPEARDSLIAHLRERGILSVFHYQPLHLSPMGRSLGGELGQCPVTEDVADRVVRLPFFNDLTDADQDDVMTTITALHGLG